MNSLHGLKRLSVALLLVGSVSCSNDKTAFEAFNSIISESVHSNCERHPGAISGKMSGKAEFSYNLKNETISVRYGFLPVKNYVENLLLENYDWYTETGSLSSMSIEDDCGLIGKTEYYPVSIQGRWEPYGTGGGKLIVALSKDYQLKVFIFGDGNFKYWDSFELTPAVAVSVLETMNAALDKSRRMKHNATISDLLDKTKGETVFYYEKDDETVFLEFDPQNNDTFYEYVVKDRTIESRIALSNDEEYLGEGKLVNWGKLSAKRGCIIYKPEDEKPVLFKPAGSRLEDIKNSILPEQFQWIIGRWVNYSDNRYSYELYKDGRFDYQYCNQGEIRVESQGAYFIQNASEDSINILLCDAEGGSTGVHLDIDRSHPVDGNALKIGNKSADYFLFPQWLNGEWTDGDASFTIKNNRLSDPERLIRRYSSGGAYDLETSMDWSVDVAISIVWLEAYSNSNKRACLYLDRNSHELAILQSEAGPIIAWLEPAKHYSSPMEVLKDLYPSVASTGGINEKMITTDRFKLYERIESEKDVLYQSQDGYTYVDNPDPQFTTYDSIENAYKVEWTRSDSDPRVELVVIFVNENGSWKIDNVIEHNDLEREQLLFDYTKPPVPTYDIESYSDEDLKQIEQIKTALENADDNQ